VFAYLAHLEFTQRFRAFVTFTWPFDHKLKGSQAYWNNGGRRRNDSNDVDPRAARSTPPLRNNVDLRAYLTLLTIYRGNWR
jgi:hypothetical protein